MAGILQGSRGKPTYNLKCVVVGDLGVGKTTLVKSYADSGENDDPRSVWQKEISMDSCIVCLTMWDTAGIMSVCIRNAKFVKSQNCKLSVIVSLQYLYTNHIITNNFMGAGCDFNMMC
jgi:GTPase SAR1 family protein